MHFIWPELLWLLLLIPLLVVGYIRALRRKRTLSVHYPSLSLIRPALGPGHRIRRHIPPALLLCALTLVLLGTARPSARVSLPADYLTLVLAMDVSRSMLAEDLRPSRRPNPFCKNCHAMCAWPSCLLLATPNWSKA